MKQDICPICFRPFEDEDIVVEFVASHSEEGSALLGHLACVTSEYEKTPKSEDD